MTEAALHRSVAEYLRWTVRPPAIWTTIPAGGGGKVRGAQLKAMGLQKGWPDIIAMRCSGGDTRVVGIELKAKKGVQSAEQKAVAKAFQINNAIYAVCRSIEDVRAALVEGEII